MDKQTAVRILEEEIAFKEETLAKEMEEELNIEGGRVTSLAQRHFDRTRKDIQNLKEIIGLLKEETPEQEA